MQDFIHLHVHTYYSILDGQSSIAKLVDKAVANIAEENGVITFDFISSYATGIREVSTNHATTDGIVYSINGQRLGTSVKTLQPGIYVRNGKKFVVK